MVKKIDDLVNVTDEFELNKRLVESGKVESILIEVKYNTICEVCGEKCDIAIFENEKTSRNCKCTRSNSNVKTKEYQKLDYYWSISEIPDNLKDATFERFEKDLSKRILNMYQGVKWHCNNLSKDKKHTLTILGSMGTGKTHLAIAGAKQLREKGLSVYFLSYSTLMRKIRESFEKDSELKQSKIFRDIKDCNVFILDDIGTGSNTEFELNTLFEVLNLRAGKSNIYTSNLSEKEFSINKTLMRIKSRLLDRNTTTVLKVIGDDYRTLPPF